MLQVANEKQMQEFGERLGRLFKGGEVIELVGDVGAGKTTLVRGIARGMGVDETVQSPSFTISRVYDASDNRQLIHYDFYRLDEPGIMQDELTEAIGGKETVVVIEWADTVGQILPEDRLTITIAATGEMTRQLDIKSGGETARRFVEMLV